MMDPRKTYLAAGLIALAFVVFGQGSGFAADEKAVVNQPAAVTAPRPASGEGQNMEQILYTLNETLEENRRIRQSMRDLQSAFEKVTVEKSDLQIQMKRLENLAIQRNKEISAQVDDLKKQAETSKAEIEKLQVENKDTSATKQDLEKKLTDSDRQNAKLEDMLKSSIMETERDQINEQIKKNDKAVSRAVMTLAAVEAQNQELREHLIRSFYDLGNTLYSLGRYDEAVIQYKRVLLWDPNHAEANHNLGIIYDYHFQKPHEAIRYYQAYLDLKPPTEKAHEVRLRLFDLHNLVRLEPPYPLKSDFQKIQKGAAFRTE